MKKCLGFLEEDCISLAEYTESDGEDCFNINIGKDRVFPAVSVEELCGARRCLMFQGFVCKNRQCKRMGCPLNESFEEKWVKPEKKAIRGKKKAVKFGGCC